MFEYFCRGPRFGSFLAPREDADAWLVEGLASHLAGKCYIAALMGNDELRYRRAREAEAVIDADDGDTLPPLATEAARVWRGGRHAGGMSAAEVKARETAAASEVAGLAGAGPGAAASEPSSASASTSVSQQLAPKSRAPRPLAPETEDLLRWKAVAVRHYPIPPQNLTNIFKAPHWTLTEPPLNHR